MAYELEVRGRSADVDRETFEHVIEQCVLTDEIGYRSVWFVEHHFTRGFSHSSAPETMLAARRRASRRVSGSVTAWCCCRSSTRYASPSASPRSTSSPAVASSSAPGTRARRQRVSGVPATVELEPRDLGGRTSTRCSRSGRPTPRRSPSKVATSRCPTSRCCRVRCNARTRRCRSRRRRWTASTRRTRGLNLLCMPILKGIDALAEDSPVPGARWRSTGGDPPARRGSEDAPSPWPTSHRPRDVALRRVDAAVVRTSPPAGEPRQARPTTRTPVTPVPPAARSARGGPTTGRGAPGLVSDTMVVVATSRLRASTCNASPARAWPDLVCQSPGRGLARRPRRLGDAPACRR